MSTFIEAQTAQELNPTQKLLKEFKSKLPKDVDKDKTSLILKKWLCKSGNFLAMFEEFGICDKLIKDALAHQKELARKSALSKRSKL